MGNTQIVGSSNATGPNGSNIGALGSPGLGTKVNFLGPITPTGIGTGGAMMGLGFQYTPVVTGKLYLIYVMLASNSVATDGALMTGKYGTGTPPTNGAAATGTSNGGSGFVSATAGQTIPVTLETVISGLVLNTPYWFDLFLQATIGGTASLNSVVLSIQETS